MASFIKSILPIESINIRKSKGPITVPWGTQLIMSVVSDIVLLQRTLIVLWDRKLNIYSPILLLIYLSLTRWTSVLLSTMSYCWMFWISVYWPIHPTMRTIVPRGKLTSQRIRKPVVSWRKMELQRISHLDSSICMLLWMSWRSMQRYQT